jgi:hypothetical protein
MKDIPDERKIYRRWRYDPHLDQVFLDAKKSEVRGYALRLDGGWRLTDIDHNTIDDPYITRRVMETLRGINKRKSSVPNDYNFEKLHYGRPLPMKG